MLKTSLKNRKETGFTIIEVLIVLAIAGLILLIVLVAVPQLQKNQRNEARKNIVSRISTEISNYTGNNRGDIPTEGTDANSGFAGGFEERYIESSDPSDPAGTHADTFMRPEGGQFTFGTYVTTRPDETEIFYDAQATCDGGETPVVSTNARDFALVVGLEGGASYCVDNGSN